jgi:DNA-binding response OmpR family regulator
MAKRVLIVDDHAPTLALIRAVLEAEKNLALVIREATTGAEALKMFDRGGPFDLVLLDIGLPDIDGLTVRSVDARVPIVFITAKGEMKDFSAGREAGCDSYLVKPISRAALRNMASLFLSVQRATDAAPPKG